MLLKGMIFNYAIILFGLNIFSSYNLNGQEYTITIEDAVESVTKKHLLNDQKSLIDSKIELQIAGIKKQNLPSINMTGHQFRVKILIWIFHYQTLNQLNYRFIKHKLTLNQVICFMMVESQNH